MDKEDVIADTVLRRLAKEEKLKAVISSKRPNNHPIVMLTVW